MKHNELKISSELVEMIALRFRINQRTDSNINTMREFLLYQMESFSFESLRCAEKQ